MKVHWNAHTECVNDTDCWHGIPKCQYCGAVMDEMTVSITDAKDWMPLCEPHNNWDTVHDMHDAGEALPYWMDKAIRESHEEWRAERIPLWTEQQLHLL